jgi:GNAT superfamily N-acetyltransferase
MAEQFTAGQAGSPAVAYLHAALALVAERDDVGVVGAVVAHPPAAVVSQFLRHPKYKLADPKTVRNLVMAGGTAIVKVKALAVHENARGIGIGSALLNRCREIYAHCGYTIVYGQMPPTPGLADFYRSCGFTVLDRSAGFDPWVIFGIHSEIHPSADESIFIWHR